jgi:glycosyltransferase involved in cell wall biosynthesis
MKKRLAIITTHPIQYNAPLFRCLSERGIVEVMVFYTWGSAVLQSKYDPGFGMIVNWDVPMLQGYDFRFLDNVAKRPGSDHFKGIDNPDIVREIDAWKPDLLLVYGWNFKSHLKILKHYKGRIPVWFRGDSTCLDDRGMARFIVRGLALGAIYRYVDKAFYTGICNKEYFKKAYVKEGKLVLAAHAVDNDFFQDPAGSYERRSREWRMELGIGENAVVFLFAGKLEKKKSPFLLLEVFKSGGFAVDSHLVFAGNGELESSLRASVGKDRVHFIGFQNQSVMPAVYRVGDVFVLPSGGPGETWGLSINEAMACGRPVIASDKCGGTADLIQNGVNGYSFVAGSAEDLKSKMFLFLQDREKLRQMGRASLAHIQNFTLTRLAQAIEQTALSPEAGYSKK